MISRVINRTTHIALCFALRSASRSVIAAGLILTFASAPTQVLAQQLFEYHCFGAVVANEEENSSLNDGLFWARSENEARAMAHQRWQKEGAYVVVRSCTRRN